MPQQTFIQFNVEKFDNFPQLLFGIGDQFLVADDNFVGVREVIVPGHVHLVPLGGLGLNKGVPILSIVSSEKRNY